MHALLEELLQILDQELEAYHRLHAMLETVQQLIIECRAEALGEQVAFQEELKAYLTLLDAERAARVDMLGERLGLPTEARTTSGLAAHLEEPYGSRVRAVAAKLRPLLERIRTLNEENRFHLAASCAFMETSLRILAAARAPRTAKLYGRGGCLRGDERRGAAVTVNRTA